MKERWTANFGCHATVIRVLLSVTKVARLERTTESTFIMCVYFILFTQWNESFEREGECKDAP